LAALARTRISPLQFYVVVILFGAIGYLYAHCL
jgi:hypothetical protein